MAEVMAPQQSSCFLSLITSFHLDAMTTDSIDHLVESRTSTADSDDHGLRQFQVSKLAGRKPATSFLAKTRSKPQRKSKRLLLWLEEALRRLPEAIGVADRVTEAISGATSAADPSNEAAVSLQTAVMATLQGPAVVEGGQVLLRIATFGSPWLSIFAKTTSCHAAFSSSPRSAARRMQRRCQTSTIATLLRRARYT